MPYCHPSKPAAYFDLLRLARIHAANDGDEGSDLCGLQALQALPKVGANVQNLLPLLYRSASRSGCYQRLAPEIQQLLKQHTMATIGQAMVQRKWLQTTLDLLSEKRIPIILLKGVAFAGLLYPAEAPRPGVDIDLLVREKDFEPACSQLEQAMTPLILAQDRLATHRTLFERVFVPEGKGGTVIEIHRGLTNPHLFDIDETRLWDSSRPHPAHHDEQIRILSPEHTLLHLAVHAFRDLDFCTHNLLDVHELVSQYPVDNEFLVGEARRWGARKVLYYLLHNAKAIMDTSIDPSLLAALDPGEAINRRNRRILQAPALNDPSKSFRYRLTQLAGQMLFPDRLSNALRFQAHYAATRIRDRFTY